MPSYRLGMMKRLRNFILVGGSLLPSSARNAKILLEKESVSLTFLKIFGLMRLHLLLSQPDESAQRLKMRNADPLLLSD